MIKSLYKILESNGFQLQGEEISNWWERSFSARFKLQIFQCIRILGMASEIITGREHLALDFKETATQMFAHGDVVLIYL